MDQGSVDGRKVVVLTPVVGLVMVVFGLVGAGGMARRVVTERPEFWPAIGRLIGVVAGGGWGGAGRGGGLGRWA